MRNLAPIVLFVYNRPEHTKKTVEGILKNPEAKDSTLYIFADGPKPNISPEGLGNLKKVREYIHTISGFKEVIIDESEKNRGLAPATIRGLSIVFEKYDRLIMIEDDDVPSKYFLAYENDCLEKYKDDARVWCVGGYTDTNYLKPRDGEPDAFFVNRPTSWGFGFWKRCWDKIIWDDEILRGIFRHFEVVEKFNKWGGLDHSGIMLGFLRKTNSSWSIRYHFASYLHNGLTILPSKTLIANIGLDGSGTHSGVQNYTVEFMERPVVIPDEIQFNKEKDDAIKYVVAPHSGVRKIMYKLGVYDKVRSIIYPKEYSI